MNGTAVVGGVFDVERWFLASLENETTLFQPLSVTYLLLAYDDIYDSNADVFRRRYATILRSVGGWSSRLSGWPSRANYRPEPRLISFSPH